MRTTRTEVEAVFKNWVSAIGGHVATSYKDVDGYRLDHNSIYGGYQIEQIMTDGGGVSISVFLNNRLTAYYFVCALRASIRSVEQSRLNTATEVR